jgi:hypothetical protein
MCDVDAQYARKIKMPMNKENKLYARMASEAKMKGLLLKDIGMAALNEIRTLKNKVLTRINRLQFVQTLKREYRRRPDIGILVLILASILFVILVLKLKNFLFHTDRYSRYQLAKASGMKISDFRIDELAVAELEADGIKEYNKTFTREPYSLENSGVYDLQKVSAILPIVMFFIMYVMPVITVVYIGWFIYFYWTYVVAAAWNFWKRCIYEFTTDKVTGSMGCKWYVRLFMGFRCRNPKFSNYFFPWKKEFIDRPIYFENLKYLREYIQARRKYYEVPYLNYITIPWKKFKIHLKYLKRTYIDRSLNIFFRQFWETHAEDYDLPRNEFYHWIMNDKLKNEEKLYPRHKRAAYEFDDLKGKDHF